MESGWNIGVVARKVGVSSSVLRVWERRYRAVRPSRTSGNQRVYGPADMERLHLLCRLCASGHRIGHVAGASVEELRALATAGAGEADLARDPGMSGPAGFLARSRKAVEAMDVDGLRVLLKTARGGLTLPRLIGNLVMPLMRWIGDRRKAGRLRLAHEHLATATIRAFLDRIAADLPCSEDDPLALVATPEEGRHEIGALAARVMALVRGWRAIYLGAGLPAAEIAAVARARTARMVIFGVETAGGVRAAAATLRRLRKELDERTVFVVGGSAATRSDAQFRVRSWTEFRRVLDRLRPSR